MERDFPEIVTVVVVISVVVAYVDEDGCRVQMF